MVNDKEKKGFWKEFKEFITRGNILDMAVGIIVGGAFTAIVNALCNNILKPIVNWILALIGVRSSMRSSTSCSSRSCSSSSSRRS